MNPRTLRVLFVDDEPENGVVFEACCGHEFDVLTATSADEALELLREHEVAVLLADQRMPRTTGLELLRRTQEDYPHTVRMLVTAYSDLSTAIEAINSGCVRRYIRKPWDRAELCATVADALDFYRTQARVRLLEQRLLETERVYALGVIAGGLGREMRVPAGAVRTKIGNALDAIECAWRLLDHSGPIGSVAQTQLFEAKVELTEALDTTERLFEAVRALEVRPKPKPDEFVDLSEVLRVALRAVQLDIRTNANFEFDMQPVGLVQGSASQLSQVVVCLLLNALHAMAGQPRSLSNLSVRLMQAGSDVCLEVADSGPAIPPEALPKVFEPLAGGLRNKTSGIGLAIARAIVEELNGKIEVENRLGGGVCFTVRFPGHEASYKPPASTLPSPKMARSAS